jgi:hypothetical protein
MSQNEPLSRDELQAMVCGRGIYGTYIDDVIDGVGSTKTREESLLSYLQKAVEKRVEDKPFYQQVLAHYGVSAVESSGHVYLRVIGHIPWSTFGMTVAAARDLALCLNAAANRIENGEERFWEKEAK